MLTEARIDEAIGTMRELLDEVSEKRGLYEDFDELVAAIGVVERLRSLASSSN